MPEGSQCTAFARPWSGRSNGRKPGKNRKYPFRRQAHSRPGLPWSSWDASGKLSPGNAGSGSYLDSAFRIIRSFFRLWYHGRVLWGSDSLCACCGNRTVFRPADELALICSWRTSAYLKFRCPLPFQAGKRGQSFGHWSFLWGASRCHSVWKRPGRNPGIFPGRGEISLRRTSEMPHLFKSRGGRKIPRKISGMREETNHRGRP